MVVEIKVETYLVRLKCDDCGAIVDDNTPEVTMDNNTTPLNLSDDTYIFKYVCPNCGIAITTNTRYPYEKYVEVT